MSKKITPQKPVEKPEPPLKPEIVPSPVPEEPVIGPDTMPGTPDEDPLVKPPFEVPPSRG